MLSIRSNSEIFRNILAIVFCGVQTPACMYGTYWYVTDSARPHVLHAHGRVYEQLHSVRPLPRYPPHYSRFPVLSDGCERSRATHSSPRWCR